MGGGELVEVVVGEYCAEHGEPHLFPREGGGEPAFSSCVFGWGGLPRGCRRDCGRLRAIGDNGPGKGQGMFGIEKAGAAGRTTEGSAFS